MNRATKIVSCITMHIYKDRLIQLCTVTGIKLNYTVAGIKFNFEIGHFGLITLKLVILNESSRLTGSAQLHMNSPLKPILYMIMLMLRLRICMHGTNLHGNSVSAHAVIVLFREKCV